MGSRELIKKSEITPWVAIKPASPPLLPPAVRLSLYGFLAYPQILLQDSYEEYPNIMFDLTRGTTPASIML